jgi:hypothetical protein
MREILAILSNHHHPAKYITPTLIVSILANILDTPKGTARILYVNKRIQSYEIALNFKQFIPKNT